jgi:hypothetical membrane protein
MKTTTLLYTGIMIPSIFWFATLVCGFIHGDYNHLTGTISELGARGTRSETLMTIFIVICTLLSVFFMEGLFKACKELGLNIIPVFSLFGFIIMFGWAAIFHSGNSLHAASGPVFLLLYLGALLAAIVWRGKKLLLIRLLSILSLTIMLLILLRFIPSVQNNYPGLVQRFAHLGWSVWFISLAVCFIKLIESKQKQQKVTS